MGEKRRTTRASIEYVGIKYVGGVGAPERQYGRVLWRWVVVVDGEVVEQVINFPCRTKAAARDRHPTVVGPRVGWVPVG